jgi:CyaY protein
MDDQEFRNRADQALESLFARLAQGAGDDDFEVDLNQGALTIELTKTGERFVVSPNSPVHQIWVSALTRSFKLEWDEARGAFVHADTQQTLEELAIWAMRTRIGDHFKV